MTAPPTLLRTPLHAVHQRAGGRMVPFAGWEMPVQYPTGIIAEHTAVREQCGLFDLSHMGRVYVRGADALALAQVCCTRDLARVPPGGAAYSLLCAPDGGILDDVIGYVLGAQEVLFVFNASNREQDVDWFRTQARERGLNAMLDDRTLQTALLGVQGPQAQALLARHTPADLDAMPGYSFVQTTVLERPALVARTGYTGEDGFEVLVEADDAEPVWEALLSGAGATACGLGARDTLRTEAGFALYGHEIDRDTNPYEARLGWVVGLAKPDFVGREALARLKKAGPSRVLVGLAVAEGGVPRPGFAVLDPAGQPIGSLTSGTYSPTLRRNIAIGYVPTGSDSPGGALAVQMRGRAVPAEVVPLPFVPHRARPRARAAPAPSPSGGAPASS